MLIIVFGHFTLHIYCYFGNALQCNNFCKEMVGCPGKISVNIHNFLSISINFCPFPYISAHFHNFFPLSIYFFLCSSISPHVHLFLPMSIYFSPCPSISPHVHLFQYVLSMSLFPHFVPTKAATGATVRRTVPTVQLYTQVHTRGAGLLAQA